MIILGLTGAMGMGKSTVARMARQLGIPVYDADRTVHRLYTNAAVIKAVAAAFPGVVRRGAVDRNALAAIIFKSPAKRQQLKDILYPRLRQREQAFLQRCARRGVKVAILDIPLLFETGGQNRVDAVLVVDAHAAVKQERVLKRPGMTSARMKKIKTLQWPQAKKMKKADAVIPTGGSPAATRTALRRALTAVQRKLAPRAHKWDSGTYARNRSRY